MKYLIDLNDESNWIAPLVLKGPDGYIGEHQHTLIYPEGERRHFTMTDSIMHKTRKEADLHYHEHRTGYEVFFVDSGYMDVYINRQKSRIEPGGIYFIQAHQAHGMFFHEDVKYRGFFHDLPYNDEGVAGTLLRNNRPDYMNDPEFPKEVTPKGDHYMRELVANYTEVPPEQCNAIRHKDRPMASYEMPGATFKMLTGRWENAGLCELWCFEMKKGFYAESYPYPVQPDLYYVTEGKIKFKVYDEEFVAFKECLVKIPKYAPRSFEVIEDAVMYDCGGLPRWDAYFEDCAAVKTRDPERAAKPETFDALRKTFDIPYKEFGVR